jgi:hypothetical protein
LQCPFSKNVYARLPAIREACSSEFDIEIVIMSLPWHFSASHAQIICHAAVAAGCDREHYIAKCFEMQHLFLNGATAELTREQTFGIFADFAEAVSHGKVSRASLVELAMTRKPIDYHMKA